MKKWISLILVFTMLITLVPTVTAQSQTTFTDVPANHWAASAITGAVKTGYVSGYPDGTFRPDQEVTREEFIKMIVVALGYDTSNYDTINDVWSMPYLAAATINGLIDPNVYFYDSLSPVKYDLEYHDSSRKFSKGIFDGEKLILVSPGTAHAFITRIEAAEIGLRALGYHPMNVVEVMKLATEQGILHGTNGGRLSIYGTVTRAQAVAIIERILKKRRGEDLPVDQTAVSNANGEGKNGWLVANGGSLWGIALREDNTVWTWGNNGEFSLGRQINGWNAYEPGLVESLGKVAQISGGSRSGLALKEDGTVWGWGREFDFRSQQFKKIPLDHVKTISAGGHHFLALKNDGTVWGWGDNDYGQLGNGEKGYFIGGAFYPNFSETPVQAEDLKNIVAISAGYSHSLALDADGNVWAWGKNEMGEAGPINPDKNPVVLPRKIEGLTDVVAIAAGYQFSLAIKKDGTVWGWGYNSYGQLGVKTPAIREGSSLRFTDKPVMIPTLNDVVQISAGYSALALRRDGTVWRLGHSAKDFDFFHLAEFQELVPNFFEPAQIEGLQDIEFIHAGYGTLFARDAHGNMWVWGENSRGELGIGNKQILYTKKPFLLPRTNQ